MPLLHCLLLLLLLCLSGCISDPDEPAPDNVAYVGPMSINLRQELGPRSPTVAAPVHGEKVEIVGRRRRFLKVRTSKGIEGWTDSRQLLTAEQLGGLQALAKTYASTPSMGAATVHDPLNVHTEPNRQSPSFFQIQGGQHVDVLQRQVAPRAPYDSPLARPRRAPAPRPAPEKEEREEKIPPPPMPPAPALPDDWLELSKTNLEEPLPPDPEEEQPTPAPPKPVAMDDWMLVRNKEGKVGWVLSRALYLAIPDEVAQYAEGHRITSYFALADVQDGDQIKHHWLWTTVSKNLTPYDYDGFRVFVYALRKHRYETAYIERNVKGYYPVEAKPANGNEPARFTVILEAPDGSFTRQTFAFQGYRVQLISKEPYTRPAAPLPVQVTQGVPIPAQQAENRSMLDRLKGLFRR